MKTWESRWIKVADGRVGVYNDEACTSERGSSSSIQQLNQYAASVASSSTFSRHGRIWVVSLQKKGAPAEQLVKFAADDQPQQVAFVDALHANGCLIKDA